MAYTALYRKLRPQSFERVVGQNHITRTLKNQINARRITHAYLFCGTRGTGKTSVAKIFAKAINCINPKDGEPCNECEICKSINRGTFINVYEIDAASNNGVDSIRNINEDVKYPPTQGNYKVYIIDEVHMLSIGAFNALLKTLEEPPLHVVFILATTDPQKIPVTIVSRCQRFDFRRITNKDMSDALKKYMDEENIDITDEAINYIAHVSDGAMRDALSTLDQCISFYFDEQITIEKVLEVVGNVDESVFFDMTDAIVNMDSTRCMNIIEQIVLKGRDISQFVNSLILHFRNLIVSANVFESTNALDYSAEKIQQYKNQALSINENKIIELINIFSELQTQIKFYSNPRIMLEVCCIKICNPIETQAYNDVETRLKNIENKISNYRFVNVEDVKKNIKTDIPIVKKAVPEDMQTVIDNWENIFDEFKDYLRSIVESHAYPGTLSDRFLYIVCQSVFFDYLKREENKKKIEDVLKKKFNKEYEIKIIKEDEYEARHKKEFGYKEKRPNFSEKKNDFEQLNQKINFNFEFVS